MSALVITKDNFNEEVINSKEPVLLDFWAPWCGPCRMVGPVVEEVAAELAGKAKIGKINVDEQSELSAQFRVMTIPTLMVFKDGKMVSSVVGVKPKKDILRMLDI